MKASFITRQEFSEIRWRGHWIWVSEEPIMPGSPVPNSRPFEQNLYYLTLIKV